MAATVVLTDVLAGYRQDQGIRSADDCLDSVVYTREALCVDIHHCHYVGVLEISSNNTMSGGLTRCPTSLAVVEIEPSSEVMTCLTSADRTVFQSDDSEQKEMSEGKASRNTP